MLKPWPQADSPTPCRGRFPLAFLPDGGPTIIPWGPSLTCTGLCTHRHLPPQPCSASLWLDAKVKSCYHYPGPHQIEPLALYLAAQTPWPGFLTLSYMDPYPVGACSPWPGTPYTCNSLPVPACTSPSSVPGTRRHHYLLASSPSDKLPLLAPPGQPQGIRKPQAAAWQGGQESGGCQHESLSP